MNLNPAELLDPVFNFLDAPIQDYGVYLPGVCLAGAAGDRLDIQRRTSQIASSICTVMFAKREKSGATIFRSRCSRTAIFIRGTLYSLAN